MNILRKLQNESGQSMVLTLLCITCMLGFVGFATDVGILLREKRNLQIAADSAAIAGALELNYGDVTAAATAAAAQNGVGTGSNGGTVTINTPPAYGAYAGLPNYVEAIVSQPQSTIFMGMFNFASVNVTARAVAYNGATSNDCIYVLNGTAADAMDLQGSFDVSAPKCGVIVDSNSTDALQFTGGGGTLTAGSVGVTGGDGGQTGDSTPTPVLGVAQQSDPLSYIVPPNPSSMTCTTPQGGVLTGTVAAGCYSAPAGGSLTVSNATLSSGTFVFTGNVVLSGSVSTAAGGATLDIATGALTEATNTVLDLVAPTSGPYNGIAIMEPAPNTNLMLFDFGSSSGLIDGIIYAPDAELELHDSGGDKSGGLQLITDLIVNTLYDQTATLSITSYSQTVNTSPLNRVALVE
jgi:Flp pilus assembly protein TadG